MDGANKRGKRNKERPTPVGTHTDAAYGFLKTSFLPKLKVTPLVNAYEANLKMERDFYFSLSQLCLYYGVEPLDVSQMNYPHNIALSLWHVQRKLKENCLHWQTIRLEQEADTTYLVSEEKYSTEETLYYIPVIPLFRVLKHPQNKQAGQLLVSVCAYLYQIAGVPYFRQQNSYLYWKYEMLNDWMEQEDETEDVSLQHNKELKKVEWIGDYMEQKIYNHHNLVVFEQRINHFKCRSESDHAYYQMAKDAFSIYRDYPGENIFRHAKAKQELSESEYHGNETITMDKYISFYADCKGCLYETLYDCINNEFNECVEIEEPRIEKYFNGNAVNHQNLDFETRIFGLIGDLCFLLNHYN